MRKGPGEVSSSGPFLSSFIQSATAGRIPHSRFGSVRHAPCCHRRGANAGHGCARSAHQGPAPADRFRKAQHPVRIRRHRRLTDRHCRPRHARRLGSRQLRRDGSRHPPRLCGSVRLGRGWRARRAGGRCGPLRTRRYGGLLEMGLDFLRHIFRHVRRPDHLTIDVQRHVRELLASAVTQPHAQRPGPGRIAAPAREGEGGGGQCRGTAGLRARDRDGPDEKKGPNQETGEEHAAWPHREGRQTYPGRPGRKRRRQVPGCSKPMRNFPGLWDGADAS